MAKHLFCHFGVTNLRNEKKNLHFELLTPWVKLLFFHFGVSNWTWKNIKLHFELLARSRMTLEIQFYLCPVHLEVHQEKKSLFIWSPTKNNYLYIIIRFCFQPLFSKLNLLLTRKPVTQN